MEKLEFNGKSVKRGKAKTPYKDPECIGYALVGSSPPVWVEETIYPNGRRTFYVEARILDGPLRKKTRVPKARTSTRRLVRRNYSRAYSGYGTTLSGALSKLEKRLSTIFKALAKALDYELQE